MVSSILLDLGNVVLPVDFDRAHRAIESRSRLTASQVQSHLWETGLVEEYELGLISSEEFFLQWKRLLEFEGDFNEFEAIWCSALGPDPILGAAVIESLREACDVVIASNTNPLHLEHLDKRFPFMRFLPRRAVSCELRAVKPDRRFFERAIAIAGPPPTDCFLVDDRPENVAAARAIGIDGEVFSGERALLEQLSRRGVRLRA